MSSKGETDHQGGHPTRAGGAGDVLAMRPLLLHASGVSHHDAASHRRVIHLEFAADRQLPDGFAWHTFLPVAP
jgi:hypothetical protein